MRLQLTIAAAGLGVSLLVGDASAAPELGHVPPPEDPYETFNRRLYAVQDQIDHAVVFPLGKFFSFITPGPIGKALHNLVTNLTEPAVIFNDVLQARFKDAGRETLRVTANSTAGLLGLMDVAAGAGLPRKDNDFGVTLGVWGVHAGPYFYLPLLGPTTARDLIGMGGEVALSPLTWTRFPGHQTLVISSGVVGGIDRLVRGQPALLSILGEAADPYATLRSVYLQNREAAIRGEAAAPILPPMEDEPSAAPETPPQTQSPSPPPAEQPTPPPSDQSPPASTEQPAPPPSADVASAPTQLAEAGAGADAPIATARPCDLVGVARARTRLGA